MLTPRALALGLLTVSLGFALGSDEPGKPAALRLFFSEVQAGSMASEHYCALVFTDQHFHFEKASRSVGKDRERTVYEGQLSQADSDALNAILEGKEFRDLNVTQQVAPVVVEDAHVITISVAREGHFQNMEFVDNKSRKPYEAQLKPLLQWWKSFRGSRKQESKAQPDARCALDSSRGVIAN